MTGDEMRDQLAAALREAAKSADETPCDETCEPGDCPSCGQPIQAFSFTNGVPDTVFGEPEAIADALLPVVRKIAADELNDLADSIPCSDSELEAKQMARARADALDPQ